MFYIIYDCLQVLHSIKYTMLQLWQVIGKNCLEWWLLNLKQGQEILLENITFSTGMAPCIVSLPNNRHTCMIWFKKLTRSDFSFSITGSRLRRCLYLWIILPMNMWRSPRFWSITMGIKQVSSLFLGTCVCTGWLGSTCPHATLLYLT